VSHCNSGKTFGGWGFAPDPEWGLILSHTLSYLRGGGREGRLPPPPVAGAAVPLQLPAASDAAV